MRSLSLFGCVMMGCQPATQTIVEFDADEALQSASRQLTVVIRNVEGEVSTRMVDLDESTVWPQRVPVSPRDGDASRRFEIEATLFATSGSTTVKASLGFNESRRFVVRLTFESACEDVECSEGFTCKDGACISTFMETEECDGFTGPGCELTTSCGCPDTFICRMFDAGPTCVRGIPFGECTHPSDCDDGLTCAFDTGRCETPSVCGHADEGESGSATLWHNPGCQSNDDCATGLVCVRAPSLREGSEVGFAGRGYCAPSCDPCAESSCGGESGCFVLNAVRAGGFCAARTHAEGESCTSGNRPPVQLCGAGMVCHEGTCRRLCRKPIASEWEQVCATESSDCREDEICTHLNATTSVCQPGQLPVEGGICFVDQCPCGLRCLQASREGPDPLFCGVAGLGCDGCPAGTRCAAGDDGVACIRLGSLRGGDECMSTEECSSGLVCVGGLCLNR